MPDPTTFDDDLAARHNECDDRAAPDRGTSTGSSQANDGSRCGAATSIQLSDIMSAVHEAAYVWDLARDTMHWSPGAAEVLGLTGIAGMTTGADFHSAIAAEHAGGRMQTITPDREAEQYRLQFRFLPGGRRSEEAIWLEDQGIVRSGPDGARIATGLIRRIDERREDDQRLRFLSDHDELTGLMNRTRLKNAVSSVIAEATARGHQSFFLLAAIDNLSLVNETFGFDVGDEAIRIVGQRLASRLRGGDAIGRFSSNKFGILVNDCNSVGLKAVVRRLQEVVRDEAIETTHCRFSLTLSVGAIMLPRDADTAEAAASGVLQALETAKSSRLEDFALFAPNAQLISRRKRNMEISEAVIAAIDEDRMRIALQPIVRTDTHEPAFHECLLRMEMPNGELTSAGYFIPLAEQLGLSRMIDHRVLELTVAHVRRHPNLHVSLNVSGLTATNHAWLVALDRLTGGDRKITNRITVEITETAAIQDLDESVNFVDALKELGCKVAIDDFGAGYTSFRNLKFLGVDMVKIDGAFVKNLSSNADDRVFVQKLAELANHFGLETVAEWVGDEESARFLNEIGITYLQGFYFGEPTIADTAPPLAAASPAA
ncbi:MAG: bifunctional diguanylate cyclase/phosphodiesterase [Pseudomonadota bacterium]